jgi:beta-lactamase superfamily II metal-dependent hydrolase
MLRRIDLQNSSQQANRKIAPADDQFEVSIMGPGRGECIVLHLGNNDWCIVDSCIDRETSLPVSVAYLQDLGSGALDRVQLVIATHWHDDHIRGLAKLVELTPSAKFCCSAALGSTHFGQLVGLAEEGSSQNSGLLEFRKIYGLLLERNKTLTTKFVSPILANENKRVLYLDGTHRDSVAQVTALSPSDGMVKVAIEAFAKSLPTSGEPQRRISVEQNDTSVALWVQVGDQHILLGADLEHSGQQGAGWMAVLASFQGKSKAQLYKIPHHGSSNGHYQQVWTDLLIQNPVAVVTPYSSGKSPLPTPSDLDRMKALTTELFCTSQGKSRVPYRDSVVERFAKSIKRKALDGQPGHVRVRWSNSDPVPKVELFNGAFRVT